MEQLSSESCQFPETVADHPYVVRLQREIAAASMIVDDICVTNVEGSTVTSKLSVFTIGYTTRIGYT